MSSMFFDNWESLTRTLIVGLFAYTGLVAIVRVTGKRTLSKLNAFDLVVTVSLGSTLATVLLNKQVALAEGILAIALLCGLQFAVSWSSVRSKWVRAIVKSEPRMVVHRGRPLESAMKAERLTFDEIHAAVREASLHDIQQVDAMVLETDGTLTVIAKDRDYTADNLPGISHPS